MMPSGNISPQPPRGRRRRFANVLFITTAAVNPMRFLKGLTNVGLWLRAVSRTDTLKRWSQYFDSDYYVRKYPDVSAKGIAPSLHFLFYGNSECRNPSPNFDTHEYLTRYPDVAQTGVNALLHFVLFGEAEGRTLNDLSAPLPLPQKQESPVETAPQKEEGTATAIREPHPRVLNNYWLRDLPLLSIVIPCFNYGEFVEKVVRSVVAQTFKDLEIIVVDGGSTDEQTLDRLRRLEAAKLPQLTIYYRDGRHLVGDNRNFGISRARGRYVGCLDADDMLSPTYCEIALFLVEGYGYDVVYSSIQCFGNSTFRWLVTDATFPGIAERNQISTTAIFRKADWVHAGGFRDWQTGRNYVPEDWEFWVRLLGYGRRPKSIREPLHLYRVHGNGITGSSDMDPDRQSQAIRRANTALFNEYAIDHDLPIRILNRWVNFDKSDDDSRPGFLLALPFVTVGGAETLLYGLAAEVSRRGFRLIVITSLILPEVVPDQVRSFEALTPHVYPLARLFHDPGVADEFLCRLARRYRVSHLFFAGCELVYHLLPRLRREFPALAVVDQLFNDNVHAPNNRRYREFIDVTVVPSQALECALQQRTPDDPGVITVIPHAVQVSEAALHPTSQTLAELSLPRDKIIVAFFGRLSPEKGGLLFVEIAHALADDENFFFIMTGEGPERQKIMESIEASRLRARFYTPGFVEDVRPLLCAADIVVVPSTLDGMPLVVLEAQAHERVVVASAVGSIPMIITDGETGYLCPAGDIGAFVERIRQLAKDAPLRAALGKAAARAVNERHDHEQMLRAYFDVFERAQERHERSYDSAAR